MIRFNTYTLLSNHLLDKLALALRPQDLDSNHPEQNTNAFLIHFAYLVYNRATLCHAGSKLLCLQVAAHKFLRCKCTKNMKRVSKLLLSRRIMGFGSREESWRFLELKYPHNTQNDEICREENSAE